MATGGNYLHRELEQSMNVLLEKRYRTLYYENGTICPVIPDLEAGAAEVVMETLREVGDADIIADGAVDIPIVDVSTEEDRYKIVMVASALGFTFQQERAERKARKPIRERKQSKVRRAIAEKHNRIGAFGDARIGFTGFLNNANVTLDDSSFNFFTATNNDTIVQFFVDTMQAVYTASNSVEEVNEVILPPEIHYELIGRRIEGTDTNLVQYIQSALSGNGMTVNMVKDPDSSSAKLEAGGAQASGTNKHRITFCAKDPEVVSRHIELVKLMPEDWHEVRNGRKIFPYYSCTTPTIVNFPGAMRYVDVPIAA